MVYIAAKSKCGSALNDVYEDELFNNEEESVAPGTEERNDKQYSVIIITNKESTDEVEESVQKVS